MKSSLVCLIALLFCCCHCYTQSNRIADSLQNLLQHATTDSERIAQLGELGDLYQNADPPKAIGYYIRLYALHTPSVVHDQILKATTAANLSGLYRLQGDTLNEVKWLDTALSIAEKIKDADAVTTVYTVASIHYSLNEQYSQAIEYNQKIIKLADSAHLPQKAAVAYIGMGNMYFKMSQNAKAVEYYEKALAQVDAAKIPSSDKDDEDKVVENAEIGLCQVFYEMDSYDSAMYYAETGLQKSIEINDRDGQCTFLESKAYTLQKQKKFNESLPLLNRAVKIAIDDNITYQLIGGYGGLAVSYAHTGNKDSAIICAKLTDDLVEKMSNSKEDRKDVYQMWSAVYEGLGDYKKAWDYKQRELDAYKQYRDNEVNKAINQNEIMFDTKRKEQEIYNLGEETKRQRIIQWGIGVGLVVAAAAAIAFWFGYRNKHKAAMILEQSNKEKEIFLKEIHHRVKNNLQIISSLLYLQFKDYKDEKMIYALQQAQQRIKSMALVHNKLYEKQDVVHVYLKEYINDLASGILASNNPEGKEINISVEEKGNMAFTLDTSISIGLILNEVITNSCKYAFANKVGGNIQINLEQSETNRYKLHIADDGAGLPGDFEKKNSLGVRLVKNLARQMGGEASFSSINGTEVTILFSENVAA